MTGQPACLPAVKLAAVSCRLPAVDRWQLQLPACLPACLPASWQLMGFQQSPGGELSPGCGPQTVLLEQVLMPPVVPLSPPCCGCCVRSSLAWLTTSTSYFTLLLRQTDTEACREPDRCDEERTGVWDYSVAQAPAKGSSKCDRVRQGSKKGMGCRRFKWQAAWGRAWRRPRPGTVAREVCTPKSAGSGATRIPSTDLSGG